MELYASQKSVVMHDSEYAELREWEHEPARTWDAIAFPRGYLILDTQRQVTELLRTIVEILTDDLPDLPTSPKDWKPSVALKRVTPCELPSDYLNQPFSQPSCFDLKKLVDIARSRCDAAEDHIRLMQTAPAYMKYYLEVNHDAETFQSLKSIEFSKTASLPALQLLDNLYMAIT